MTTLKFSTNGALVAAAFILSLRPAHAADPVTTKIRIPKTVMTTAMLVNDSGDTAGVYLDYANIPGAFVDTSGTPETFTVPWGTNPVPTSMNENGVMVGYYIVSQDVVRGFLRRAGGKLTQIDPPGAVTSCPRVVTTSGDVAGVYSTGNKRGHGYIMTGNQFVRVDYPGATTTTLTDMNAAGIAVGIWIDGNNRTHGLLRSPQGGFTSVDFPGARSTQAIKVDAEGNLIGFYQSSTGAEFGFLRTTDGNFKQIAPPRATSANITGFVAGAGIVGMSSVDSAPSSPSIQGATAYLLDASGQYKSVEVKGATITLIKGSSSTGWIAGAYLNKNNLMKAFKLKLSD